MSERALPIKVVYTVNPSPQPIVAYQKRTPVAVIPPVDGAQGSSSLGFGQAPLKACLRAICSASPHLLSDIERDYSVYVLDPLEEALTHLPLPGSITGPQQTAQQQPQSSPALGVAVGMGLMSWCLAEEQDDASEPTLVIGRLLKHPASGDMVEIVVTLQETRSRSQEQVKNRMKSWSAPSTAPVSIAAPATTGSKRGKRAGALPTPTSTSSPAPPAPREVVDLTCDEPQSAVVSTRKRPDGKKPNLTSAPLQGPTPYPYQPHVFGSKALAPGSSRKPTLSGTTAAKSAPLKRSMTTPVNASPLNSTNPIALLPAPADPFCPAIDIDIAGVSAYHVGQFLTTAARLAEGNVGTTVDVAVAQNFRAAFPQLFPVETRRSPAPASDAPKPTAPVARASSVDRRPGSSKGAASRTTRTDNATQPALSIPPKRPPALLPPPNLSSPGSASREPLASPAAVPEPESSVIILDADAPGEKENVSPDVQNAGKKRRLSDSAEETTQPRKKLNSEDNTPPTSTDPVDAPGPSAMPALPSTPRAQRRIVSRPPSPTSSPLFSPDPQDLASRVPRTPARVPTTPARPSGGTHRIFGSAHLSFSGMIDAQPFFSPLRRTPGTTALLFEMGIGHLSSSPVMRGTSPTPASRVLPPSPWRSLQIDVGILPPSSPLPPTSSPAREFGNPFDDEADIKMESPVDRMFVGSRGQSVLSEDADGAGTSSRATSMSQDSTVPPGDGFIDDQTLLADLDAGNYAHFDNLWALFQPMIAAGGAAQPQQAEGSAFVSGES
ncbi:hypothetical protein AURDEDRAFT_183080 [Auricularia subglabra TFB-10046 SS5]|nr:hypothetical protein AURDEDRAFT_183080 [Auricularia subglabra TFB-10046 SS5]